MIGSLPHAFKLRITAPLALIFATYPLPAQDTRNVKEPTIPPACTVLKAALTTASVTSGDLEARADKSGSDKSLLDTARIQQALDHCDKGHAVQLEPDGANTAFLAGPLSLRPGVTLLVDKGVTLFAARNPELYALGPGSCGIVNDVPSGCKPLITAHNASGSAIMGDGVIDGQGGSAMIVDGKAAAISWWDLAEQTRSAGHQQSPRLIDSDFSDDLTLYRITLRNSPNTHLAFRRGEGLTVWAITIDSPKSARNTAGIVAEQARNITVTESFIRAGDDNVAIKAEDAPTSNVTVSHNHFYSGHGMSIGDETIAGVSQVRVSDLTLDGTDNGLRINSSSSHGGLVEDVVYDDICIRNAKNPILFDTAFSFPGKGIHPVPVYRDIALRNVRISGGGRIQFNGFDDTHRVAVTLDGVYLLDGADRYRTRTIHADLTFGAAPVNLVLIGDDSTAINKPARGSLPGCTAKFVPFP